MCAGSRPAPARLQPHPHRRARRQRTAARLYAALAADGPGRTLRVDGLVLTTTPQLISAATPLGAPEGHTLEIETSRDGATSVPETIVWTAEIR